MHKYLHRFIPQNARISPYLPNNLMPVADGHDRTWYNLKSTEAETDVYIYDEISWWGITADELVAEIVNIQTPAINVHINSPGGNVFDGLAIANALKKHPATVTAINDSLAASIATIIMMGADARQAESNSLMMIHNAWGLAVGDHHEMMKTAELLQKVTDTLAQEYANVGNLSKDEFLAAMDNETWYSAGEAADAGLVDVVLNAPESTPADKSSLSIFDLSQFDNVPDALKNAYESKKPQKPAGLTNYARARKIALLEKVA